ncbi:MAG TPA: HWE histidine kinase domain-containing protein, partial [Piscinibacter sp.]|nr:HWE histidine kinase domain-containing protein [Piscinibacter sp.]
AAAAHARVSLAHDAAQHLYGVAWPGRADPVDVSIHDSGGLLVIEAEPASDEDTLRDIVCLGHCAEQLAHCNEIGELATAAARGIAELARYDRVMVYRFSADGSGSVIAEQVAPGLPTYLGLRYPASDIPAQARALYLRSPSRIICDVADDGIDVLGHDTAALDLSLSTLRSVSPVHLQYLRNMGTAATMSITLRVNGRLWGLVVCHHGAPKRPALACRAIAETLGRLFGLAIGRLESEGLQQDISTLLLSQPGVEPLVDEDAAPSHRQAVLAAIGRTLCATGASLHLDGRTVRWGEVPPPRKVAALCELLADTPVPEAVVVDSLAQRWPSTAALAPRVAGMVAVPLSQPPRDWLLLFRDEVRRHVVWAGNPNKSLDDERGNLTPRGSFAAWRESVRLHGEPWTPLQVELAEVLRVRIQGLLSAQREQRDLRILRRDGQRQALLVRELNHRIRNILALVKGLVQQSAARSDSVEELAATLQNRVGAMARAHMQIEQTRWGPAPLLGLMEDEIRPFSDTGQSALSGPPIQLEPNAYMSLALVVHELATNARKYGALSQASGRLAVHWEVDRNGALCIDWRESGGPATAEPTRRGFGSRVIAEALAHELQGRTEVQYLPGGLQARLVIPRGFERAAGAAVDSAGLLAVETLQRGAPLSVLLVEDDLVIALTVEAMLAQLGCTDVIRVGRAPDALALLAERSFDIAMIDVDLGDHTSESIADRLAELGIPLVVASGHAQTDHLPAALRGHPSICKPYGALDVQRAFASALQQR